MRPSYGKVMVGATTLGFGVQPPPGVTVTDMLSLNV
jgi:hypothetical protein